MGIREICKSLKKYPDRWRTEGNHLVHDNGLEVRLAAGEGNTVYLKFQGVEVRKYSPKTVNAIICWMAAQTRYLSSTAKEIR